MTVIEPTRHHQCEQPRDSGMAEMTLPESWGGTKVKFPKPVEHGTLWRCLECRTWWVARPNPMHGHGLYFGGGGLVWDRVGWWNVSLRHRIRREIR